MELLKQQIEALIFCSEQSISLQEISASLKLAFDWELTEEEIITAIDEIKERYKADEFAFELVDISEGYQFMTKKQFYPTISGLIQHKAKKKLSVAQMETLAIIAYRQPLSKAEIEHIRGVSCDYAVHKLLEKELIEISGKSEGPGRPVLYSTSRTFMDYFGIKSVRDLPQLKDIHMEQNEIGMNSEMSDGPDEQHGSIEVMAGAEAAAETSSQRNLVEENSDTSDLTISHNSPVTPGDEVMIASEAAAELAINDVLMSDHETGIQPGDFSAEMEIPDRKSIFLQRNETEKDEEGIKNSDEEIS
jgi:segregation and condensation protein B